MGDIGEFFEKNVWTPLRNPVTSQLKNWGDDLVGKNSLIGKGYRGLSDWGAGLGDAAGVHTPATTAKNQARDAAVAAADRAVKQAEYEEQAAMGAERARSKRRRGLQSTILTGGKTSLGGGLADSGKTLLGD